MYKSIDIKKIAELLKYKEFLLRQAKGCYQSMGGEFPESADPDYANLLLDMFGVPEDEYTKKNKKGFCRDWLENAVYSYFDDEITIEELDEEIFDTVKDYNDFMIKIKEKQKIIKLVKV